MLLTFNCLGSRWTGALSSETTSGLTQPWSGLKWLLQAVGRKRWQADGGYPKPCICLLPSSSLLPAQPPHPTVWSSSCSYWGSSNLPLPPAPLLQAIAVVVLDKKAIGTTAIVIAPFSWVIKPESCHLPLSPSMSSCRSRQSWNAPNIPNTLTLPLLCPSLLPFVLHTGLHSQHTLTCVSTPKKQKDGTTETRMQPNLGWGLRRYPYLE